MSWLKIDDGFAEHPKIQELADRTFRLHVVALCYCARNLTDGVLTDRSVRIVAAIIGTARVTRNINELVAAGLWIPAGDGYTIKDYLDYNPSSQKVRDERIKARERMAKGRAHAAGNVVEDVSYAMILERDGHVCHICGGSVAPEEVSFDHVVPLTAGGAHSEDNIKVGHLVCNLKKNKYQAEVFGRTSGELQRNFAGSSVTPTRPVVKNLKPSGEESLEDRQFHALRLYGEVRDRYQTPQLRMLVMSYGHKLAAAQFQSVIDALNKHRHTVKDEGAWVSTALENQLKERAA